MWIGSNVPPKMPHRTPRHVALPGLRLPFELGAADPDRVAGRDARPAQLGVDAEPRERALEALGRLLDVEVRLGGDPLDPRAADAEHPVGVELDGEAVAHRVDAVDDDPGGFGRLGELGRVRQDLRDAGAERGEALAGGGRDGQDVHAFGRPGTAEGRPRLGGRRQVDLVERDEHRLLEQRRIVRPELLADDVVVPLGVARRAVDDVDEDPRPLDVAQEGMTETGAAAGALDEAGHVGDGRAALVALGELHDAEVGFERRERVVGDLGRRGGDRGEDRRLAGVRQPDEADVGDEPELEADPRLGAGLALLGVLGCLVGRGLEVRVAEAAAPAAGDHRALADGDEVRQQLPGLVGVDRRAGRDVEGQVVAGLAVPAGPRAATAGRRPEMVPVVEVAEGGLAGIDPQDRPSRHDRRRRRRVRRAGRAPPAGRSRPRRHHHRPGPRSSRGQETSAVILARAVREPRSAPDGAGEGAAEHGASAAQAA